MVVRMKKVFWVLIIFILLFFGLPYISDWFQPLSNTDSTTRIYYYVSESCRYWINQGTLVYEYWSDVFNSWLSAN